MAWTFIWQPIHPNPRGLWWSSATACVSIQDATQQSPRNFLTAGLRCTATTSGDMASPKGNVASTAHRMKSPRISTVLWTSPQRKIQALSAFCWATAWAALPWLTFVQNIPIRQKAPFCLTRPPGITWAASAVSPSPLTLWPVFQTSWQNGWPQIPKLLPPTRPTL